MSYDNTRRLSAITWRHVTFVDQLRSLGVDNAYLHGVPASPGAPGGSASLNAFFLLLDRPEVYNLPSATGAAAAPDEQGAAHRHADDGGLGDGRGSQFCSRAQAVKNQNPLVTAPRGYGSQAQPQDGRHTFARWSSTSCTVIVNCG